MKLVLIKAILIFVLSTLTNICSAQTVLKQIYVLHDFEDRGYTTSSANAHFATLANGKKYELGRDYFNLIDNAIKHAKKKKVMQHKMGSSNRLFCHFIYEDKTVHQVIIFYNAIEDLTAKKIYWVDDKATQAEMKQMIARSRVTYGIVK